MQGSLHAPHLHRVSRTRLHQTRKRWKTVSDWQSVVRRDLQGGSLPAPIANYSGTTRVLHASEKRAASFCDVSQSRESVMLGCIRLVDRPSLSRSSHSCQNVRPLTPAPQPTLGSGSAETGNPPRTPK